MRHIVIVTEEQLLLTGLRAMLRAHQDYQILSTHPSSIITACREAGRPDILICDSRSLTAQNVSSVRFGLPHLVILVLDRSGERTTAKYYQQIGCDGIVDPRGSFEDLLHVLGTRPHRGTCEAGHVERAKGRRTALPSSNLSSRECEVLSRISEGATSKEIAFSLGIRPSTVEVYRRSIIRKTGIGSVAELTRYAIRSGLSEL